jgi:uncharacterized protein (TIGR02569 family)
VVIKPADSSEEELAWQADLLADLESDAFRIARPRRSLEGKWVVDGWCATDYLPGSHESGRWAEIIRAGDAFHSAVVGRPRPAFLDGRSDRWAIGDRAAWGELDVGDFGRVDLVVRLASARRPLDAPSQLIHGDLTGNVLFADGLLPAIIDLSVYWRPQPFAAAIVVADALVWEGAEPSLLESVRHIEGFGQYLIRALIYRLVAEAQAPGGDRVKAADDPYFPAVELALDLLD